MPHQSGAPLASVRSFPQEQWYRAGVFFSPLPFPLSFFRPRTYRKGYYFYSPQSPTVLKSKMAATTILRTRTRFRPPKIRLHCRLIPPLNVTSLKWSTPQITFDDFRDPPRPMSPFSKQIWVVPPLNPSKDFSDPPFWVLSYDLPFCSSKNQVIPPKPTALPPPLLSPGDK